MGADDKLTGIWESVFKRKGISLTGSSSIESYVAAENAYNDALIFLSTLPMWGATAESKEKAIGNADFLPTLSMRGATAIAVNVLPQPISISIHAPHAGSDRNEVLAWCRCHN